MIWPCNPPDTSDLVHPHEERAILEIQKSDLYHYVAQFCGDLLKNTAILPKMRLSGFPVTESSSPRAYRCYQKALQHLNCREEYPLFVDFGYELTAKTLGSDENGYVIVVNSACIDQLNDDELTAFLGGEIGHARLGHSQNRALLDNMEVITKRLPVAGDLVKDNLEGFFAYWMIASEYSADRAALFASESLEAVISLRKQQMGLKVFSTDNILEQAQTSVPDKLGMYYVMMAKDIPAPGAVDRIQELHRWIQTPEFRNKFPCLYYKLCLENSELVPSEDQSIYKLHQRAIEGDADSLAKLGESYLLGKGDLGQIPISGIAFLKEAALRGNARALFLVGTCLETGVPDGRKKSDEASWLYRAAASRGDHQAAARTGELDCEKMPQVIVDACRYTAKSALDLPRGYWNALSGEEPDQSSLREAMNWFWIPVNETLIAAELHKTSQGYTGLVLTGYGIYGSCIPGNIPLFISWERYREKPLTQRSQDDGNYLCCGDQKFYLCQETIKGTLTELLLRIKAALEA